MPKKHKKFNDIITNGESEALHLIQNLSDEALHSIISISQMLKIPLEILVWTLFGFIPNQKSLC